jgi:hypothetical protein
MRTLYEGRRGPQCEWKVERGQISWINEREEGSGRPGNLCFQLNKYLLFSFFVGGGVRYERNTEST